MIRLKAKRNDAGVIDRQHVIERRSFRGGHGSRKLGQRRGLSQRRAMSLVRHGLTDGVEYRRERFSVEHQWESLEHLTRVLGWPDDANDAVEIP